MPDSFADALGQERADSIDVAAARRQHEGYRRALEAAGYEVTILPADEDHPDSPFVEDTAVIHGGVAVISRPGASSRRGETAAVAAALARHLDVTALGGPGTLDGGDVLVVGDRVYVGRSSRTDAAGAAALAGALGVDVTTVPVAGVLHLKSAVTALDDGTLLGAARAFPAGAFAGLRWLEVPPGESAASNVVAVGGGKVLVPAGHQATVALLAAAGYEPVPVAAGEFAKADGGLTCLSLRWER